MQTLRPYQTEGLARIEAAWASGARAVLAVAPTGSGKTTVFAYLGAQYAAQGKRVIVLTHRRELAEQAAKRFSEFNVRYGFIVSGMPSNTLAPVQVASVQTLHRRETPPADLVICDEAHLSTANTWHSILARYPSAQILGVTATPWRLGGKSLIGAYDKVVVISTPRELCEQGYLCKYTGFSYEHPDMSNVERVGDDYNAAQSGVVMRAPGIVDSIIEEWHKHASQLSTVVFAVTVEHSKELCERFRASGATAEHLDGATPIGVRGAILERVRSGRTSVLCNVGVAVEGLDIPRLKCCVLARPTMSLARAIQMMGRVRRVWEGQVARIHDHAFVVMHGLPDDDRDYELSSRALPPPASLSTCQVCYAVFRGKVCPECSHERVSESRSGPALITGVGQVEFTSSTPVEPLGPVSVTWNTPGKVVEGVLMGIDTEPQYNRKRYTLRGKRDYICLGAVDLDARMRSVEIGCHTRITYVGEIEYGVRSKKQFKVEVSR